MLFLFDFLSLLYIYFFQISFFFRHFGRCSHRSAFLRYLSRSAFLGYQILVECRSTCYDIDNKEKLTQSKIYKVLGPTHLLIFKKGKEKKEMTNLGPTHPSKSKLVTNFWGNCFLVASRTFKYIVFTPL